MRCNALGAERGFVVVIGFRVWRYGWMDGSKLLMMIRSLCCTTLLVNRSVGCAFSLYWRRCKLGWMCDPDESLTMLQL